MEELIEENEAIAEVRSSTLLATDFVELSPGERAKWGTALEDRTTWPAIGAPAVCLLDTGVNRGHPLLSSVLKQVDLHTLNPQWGTNDHHGHGTEMAGLATYGDLAPVLGASGPIVLSHRLESVKLLPPDLVRRTGRDG